MKRTVSIIILITLVSGLHMSGRSRPMTLGDCLAYASQHARSVRIGRVRTAMAETDVRLASSSFMPSLDFYTGGNISFGRNIDPETNTYDTRKTVSNSYSLSMSLPLFNGLVSINNLKAAKVAWHRQRYAEQIESDRISLEVISAFYALSYTGGLVRQMQSQLSRDSLILAKTVREYELGIKSGADVADLRAVVSADEYELIRQQNNLEKARLTLKDTMGMQSEDEDPVPVESDFAPGEPYRENPRLTAARLAVQESRLRVRMAAGSMLPTISLNLGISTSFYRLMGQYGYGGSFGRQLRDNMGEYVGVSFSFPVFRGLSRVNSLKRARLNEVESRLQLEETISQVERETAEALLDHRAATEEYRAAERRLEAEQAAYTATRRKFELGEVSTIELFTAGARLAEAEAVTEGKRIQHIISGILLEYYRGATLIQNLN